MTDEWIKMWYIYTANLISKDGSNHKGQGPFCNFLPSSVLFPSDFWNGHPCRAQPVNCQSSGIGVCAIFLGTGHRNGKGKGTWVDAKVFDRVNHNKLWKILKQMGILDHLTSLLRNLYVGQEATQLDMEQWTGSKLRKEYIKAVYCHPAYLTNIQSKYHTKCQAGWITSWNQDCQEK